MPCGSVEAFGLAGRGQCGSSSVVEHHLAKVGVAGPSPVFRSMIFTRMRKCAVFIFLGVLARWCLMQNDAEYAAG